MAGRTVAASAVRSPTRRGSTIDVPRKQTGSAGRWTRPRAPATELDERALWLRAGSPGDPQTARGLPVTAIRANAQTAQKEREDRAAAEEAARLAEMARVVEVEQIKAEAKSKYIAAIHTAQLVARERVKKKQRIAVYGYEAEWAFEEAKRKVVEEDATIAAQ